MQLRRTMRRMNGSKNRLIRMEYLKREENSCDLLASMMDAAVHGKVIVQAITLTPFP